MQPLDFNFSFIIYARNESRVGHDILMIIIINSNNGEITMWGDPKRGLERFKVTSQAFSSINGFLIDCIVAASFCLSRLFERDGPFLKHQSSHVLCVFIK